jgi:thiol:disulfide interchange protein DsbD
VILDLEEKLLVQPQSYNTNISEFVTFLDQAKLEFENRKN